MSRRHLDHSYVWGGGEVGGPRAGRPAKTKLSRSKVNLPRPRITGKSQFIHQVFLVETGERLACGVWVLSTEGGPSGEQILHVKLIVTGKTPPSKWA